MPEKIRTKIICTIGPASREEKVLRELIESGMTVARLNFSHGTHEDHAELFAAVRHAALKSGRPNVAIMQDLQGPKIRIGVLPTGGLLLKNGEKIFLNCDSNSYDGVHIPLPYRTLVKNLKPKERVLLDDGRLELQVVSIKGFILTAKVVVGGQLTSNKGVNLPDTDLSVSALSKKDLEDLEFGVSLGVDLIALSFVTKPEDILDAKFAIVEAEKKLKIPPSNQPIRLIAKIERREAVERITEILDVADGIMVARGDLGVEMPAAEVPLIQKRLIDAALLAGKPVIVATQMLDSMQKNPRPTRAEVSDVANAVIDHTDAVMLSNETATGDFPVDAARTMETVIKETEKSAYDNLVMREPDKNESVGVVITSMARLLAERVEARLILAASFSGETARLISRYRPELPIYVATPTERVARQMNLLWGVRSFILPECRSIEELVERSILYLKEKKIVRAGDKMIIVAGEPVGEESQVNLLEVRTVA